MKCSKCGKEITGGSDFCRFCGVKVIKMIKNVPDKPFQFPRLYLFLNVGFILSIIILYSIGNYCHSNYCEYADLVEKLVLFLYAFFVANNLFFIVFTFSNPEKRTKLNLIIPLFYLVSYLILQPFNPSEYEYYDNFMALIIIAVAYLAYSLIILMYSEKGWLSPHSIVETKPTIVETKVKHEEKKDVCPKCGYELGKEDIYCQMCGKKVK